MEPVHAVNQERSAQDKLIRLVQIVIVVCLVIVGIVVGWIIHDHLVMHIKHTSATSAISTTTTQGGER